MKKCVRSVRSFFYSRSRKSSLTFDKYLENFVNPNLTSADEDIIDFLSGEFGIEYIPDKTANVFQDPVEVEKISSELERFKHKGIAENHALTALAVYSIREKKNEKGNLGVFGYQTWWLSQDIKTYLAIHREFPEKYSKSCYMRPDFLFNYISIAPQRQHVDCVFEQMFPSLLGVSISYHLPNEVFELTQKLLEEHREKNPTRVKSILRNLADKIKSDPDFQDSRKIKHFLDDEIEELEKYSQV